MHKRRRKYLRYGVAAGVLAGILCAALFYWLLDENIPVAMVAFITPVIVCLVAAYKL